MMKLSKKQFIRLVAGAAMILNSASFMLVRLAYCKREADELEVYRDESPGGVMNYLVAGCYDQPTDAYAFLFDNLKGGITFVNYRMLGWSAKRTADAIRANARKFGYKVRLYVLSEGDQVARYLDEHPPHYEQDSLKIISLNPCNDRGMLHPPLRSLMKYGTHVFQIVCAATGWISAIPFLPSNSGMYSPILLADQFSQIARTDIPQWYMHTLGYVISSDDIFLDAKSVQEKFPDGVPHVTITAKHTDTRHNAAQYLAAIREIETMSE